MLSARAELVEARAGSDRTTVRALITIDDVAPGGEGVGRLDGRAVFVPFTAPGDRVVAEVPAGEGVAHAALVEVEAPGPSRVPAPCRHFGPAGACGGCEWLHLAYAAQLAVKERTVVEALRRIARLAPGSYPLHPV